MDDAGAFEVAARHVAARAAGGSLGEEVLLRLYALYKQASEGQCSTSRPGVFSLTARRKWDAWQALGDMLQADAARGYVELLSQLEPGWREETRGSRGRGGAGGAVFSRLAAPEDDREEEGGDALPLHAAAMSGDCQGVEAALAAGADVDARDAEQATALHLAADRGHVAAMELLIEHGASVHAVDADGLTPLAYACLGEHRQAAERLVAAGSNPTAGPDGQRAHQLAPGWGFLQQA